MVGHLPVLSYWIGQPGPIPLPLISVHCFNISNISTNNQDELSKGRQLLICLIVQAATEEMHTSMPRHYLLSPHQNSQTGRAWMLGSLGGATAEIRLAYLNLLIMRIRQNKNATIWLLSQHEIQSACLRPAALDCHSGAASSKGPTAANGPDSALAFWGIVPWCFFLRLSTLTVIFRPIVSEALGYQA